MIQNIASRLDLLYDRLNQRKYVHPDPLEFLYFYNDIRDREIVGLVSSSLAYGRVAQILKSVSAILKKMGPEPSVFLKESNYETLKATFEGFVHRFATGDKMAAFLTGVKAVVEHFGSLEQCFTAGLVKNEKTVFPALDFFAGKIRQYCPACPGHLVPVPGSTSACKRLNLYFRWMVRCDAVDPGGWDIFRVPKLIVPLDIHMHRICLQLGFTRRKTADMKTAMEITRSFVDISSHDPVKYDFVLTRIGIRDDLDPGIFYSSTSNIENAKPK
ncbi:MAG: TIGR02757 family protein [Desulfobacterales bacterium]